MNAWEENVRLIAECDNAITRCAWCSQYGHNWSGCELYRMSITPPPPKKSVWRVVIWLMTGFVAGVAFKALTEGL